MGNKSGKEKKGGSRRDKKQEYTDVDSPTRINVCNEIIQTEELYIASLESIVTEFITPLKNNPKILKRKLVNVIFSNIEEILEVQRTFLVKLQQAASNTSTQRLGHVLSQEAPSLKVYTTYINNYNEALSTLYTSQKKYPSFQKFLAEKAESEECKGLSLSAYLIMPIQRIPRYVLLFSDLLKQTTENHIDYKPTQLALDEIKEVADYVNEEKRIAEELQKCHEIESNLHHLSFKLALRNRTFIKEGTLNVIDKKGAEPVQYQYLLFNDLILFTNEVLSGTLGFLGVGTKKMKVQYEAKLLNTQIVELKDRHDLQNAFELTTKKMQIIITFTSNDEKTEWLDEFYKIRAKAPVIE